MRVAVLTVGCNRGVDEHAVQVEELREFGFVIAIAGRQQEQRALRRVRAFGRDNFGMEQTAPD